jgi:NAD(P)-dependent dehydrogenase (short-subunit alcohol dehydrogenase family)
VSASPARRAPRVLITGASSGFGLATAEWFRSRRAPVIGLDLRPGPDVLIADVRDQVQVDRAVDEAVRRLGGLDVLVNNAGIGIPQSAGRAPDERARAVIETNFIGAWRVTSAALPTLLGSGGRVVNVASGMAWVTLPFSAAYTASKRALVAYSDVLRQEHGDRITVTVVYPGYVRTPIHRPGERMGLSLAGAIPEERLETVVRAMVRACTGPPRRVVTTGPLVALGVLAGRHVPWLTDRVVAARARALARRGRVARLSMPRPDRGREDAS